MDMTTTIDVIDKLKNTTGDFAGLAREAIDEIEFLRGLVGKRKLARAREHGKLDQIATGGWSGSYVGSVEP